MDSPQSGIRHWSFGLVRCASKYLISVRKALHGVICCLFFYELNTITAAFTPKQALQHLAKGCAAVWECHCIVELHLFFSLSHVAASAAAKRHQQQCNEWED